MVRKVDCGRLTPRQIGFVSSYVRDAYCRPESVIHAPDRVGEWKSEFQKATVRPQSAPYPSSNRLTETMQQSWQNPKRHELVTPSKPKEVCARGFASRRWGGATSPCPVGNLTLWLDRQVAQLRDEDQDVQIAEDGGSSSSAARSPSVGARPASAGASRNGLTPRQKVQMQRPASACTPRTTLTDRQKAQLWRKRNEERKLEERRNAKEAYVETTPRSAKQCYAFPPQKILRGSTRRDQHGGRKTPRQVSARGSESVRIAIPVSSNPLCCH